MNKHKKDVAYYLNLPWTYTVEKIVDDRSTYYIIRVNEFQGICTDAEDLNEGMSNIVEALTCAIEMYLEKNIPIPEPISKEKFKGNILYRTDQQRHWQIAKIAKDTHKSISKTLDILVDTALKVLPTMT